MNTTHARHCPESLPEAGVPRAPRCRPRGSLAAALRICAIFVCAALVAQSVSGAESLQESGQPSAVAASGAADAPPPAVIDEPARDSEVTFRRSIDDPADASSAPGTGAPDPKLVPIALSMVGLLAVIGLGTAIYAWCTRNKRDARDR